MAQSTGNPAVLQKTEAGKAMRNEAALSSQQMILNIATYDRRIDDLSKVAAAAGKLSLAPYPEAGANWTRFQRDTGAPRVRYCATDEPSVMIPRMPRSFKLLASVLAVGGPFAAMTTTDPPGAAASRASIGVPAE